MNRIALLAMSRAIFTQSLRTKWCTSTSPCPPGYLASLFSSAMRWLSEKWDSPIKRGCNWVVRILISHSLCIISCFRRSDSHETVEWHPPYARDAADRFFCLSLAYAAFRCCWNFWALLGCYFDPVSLLQPRSTTIHLMVNLFWLYYVKFNHLLSGNRKGCCWNKSVVSSSGSINGISQPIFSCTVWRGGNSERRPSSTCSGIFRASGAVGPLVTSCGDGPSHFDRNRQTLQILKWLNKRRWFRFEVVDRQ